MIKSLSSKSIVNLASQTIKYALPTTTKAPYLSLIAVWRASNPEKMKILHYSKIMTKIRLEVDPTNLSLISSASTIAPTVLTISPYTLAMILYKDPYS